jgi:hypothetical protein
MNRRVIFIILGALFFLGIVLLLWLWFLGRQQAAGTANLNANGSITSNVGVGGNGQAGSGTDTGVGTHTVLPGNGQATTSTNTSGTFTANGGNGNFTSSSTQYTGSNFNANGGGTVGTAPKPANSVPFYTIDRSTNGTSTYTMYSATTTPLGAVWVPGSGNPFNPTGVNGVIGTNPTGNGNILNPLPTTIGTAGQNPNDLIASLAVIGVGTAACTAGLLATSVSGQAAGILSSLPTALVAVQTNSVAENTALSSNQVRDNFLNCIARTLGRAIVEQITKSVVNWINSGFQGKPTFVQNFDQFFSNVANQAAGAYIQGSALSFLCSPFSLQVKIAVAKSYANQGASPQSCSLSKVSTNINKFMGGQFSAGGWQSMVSFNSVPTNNPYGAYAYGQVGINNAVLNAQKNAKNNISPQGFLNLQEAYDCSNTASAGVQSPTLSSTPNSGVCPAGCKCRVTTPGSVIASTVDKTLFNGVDQLNLAKNFDEIINALMRQLLNKALYGGLSNLSGQAGLADPTLTPEQQQAATLAQNTLASLQAATNVNQQYGYTEQGTISDVQSVQSNLQNTYNCWQSAAAATSSPLTDSQRTAAANNASSTLAQISLLQTKVDLHNNTITQINSAIALLEQLESRVLNANSLAVVQGVASDYGTAQSNGTLYTQSDVVRAQQNRASLQTSLTPISQTASAQLTQCYALGIPKTN